MQISVKDCHGWRNSTLETVPPGASTYFDAVNRTFLPDGEPVLAVATWPDVGGNDGRERLEHKLRWFVRQRLRRTFPSALGEHTVTSSIPG